MGNYYEQTTENELMPVYVRIDCLDHLFPCGMDTSYA